MKYFEDDDSDEIKQSKEGRFFNQHFLKQRKIFLWGPVMDDSARDITNRLLYLEDQKPGENIYFFINSPGGVVTSGMVIYDTIKMISSPVVTICTGLAASMASILLSVGAKGKRYIYPNGRVLIHQPSIGETMGDATDLEIEAREIVKIKHLGAEILATNCSQPIEKIYKDFDRDYWMDANEALQYGIVDKIVNKMDEIYLK